MTRLQFAGEHTDQPVWLLLEVPQDATATRPARLGLEGAVPAGATVEEVEWLDGGLRCSVAVPGSGMMAEDDEHAFRVVAPGRTVAEVVLRRTTCRVNTWLVDDQDPDNRVGGSQLLPETRAALLWYGWRRFLEVMILKRFTTGKGGSDVLLVRPLLRGPDASPGDGLPPAREGSAWGACLIAKTGRADYAREEWDRFQDHLVDRLHPYMARSEAFLSVAAPSRRQGPTHLPMAGTVARATIVSSFMGGDLLQAEPLESVIRQAGDSGRCREVLDTLFRVMAAWYDGGRIGRLGDWGAAFPPGAGPLRLFGVYDFTKEDQAEVQRADPGSEALGRTEFRAGLQWDTWFITERHLRDHLLGKDGRGLLPRLTELPLRYSLIHGDLHPRNVVVDRHNVWLLDFGQTGVAPTLYDFAKLEVYLRLWCLDLAPTATDPAGAAARFERLLLDLMTGSESSLEPIRALAPALGADPAALERIAVCISAIRHRAAAYGVGGPDRRDYLAVLLLTVLGTVRYAGREPGRLRNHEILVALYWLLEDVLSRVVGLQPF